MPHLRTEGAVRTWRVRMTDTPAGAPTGMSDRERRLSLSLPAQHGEGAHPCGCAPSPCCVLRQAPAGTEGSVPARAHTEAAASEAADSMSRTSSGSGAAVKEPRAPSRVSRPAANASPAPIVLTTRTGVAGTDTGAPPAVYAVLPFAPRVRT